MVNHFCQTQDNYIPDIRNNIIDDSLQMELRGSLTLILIPMSGDKTNQRKGKSNTINNTFDLSGFGDFYVL